MTAWLYLLLVPVVFSAAFWAATTVCVAVFMRSDRYQATGNHPKTTFLPAVSLIKPVCGLEKNLYENLLSACRQDYPDFEVIFAVQDGRDPALAVIDKITAELSGCRIRVVVDSRKVGVNGKVNNLCNAVVRARGQVLAISDSDMHLAPDYLRRLVVPLGQAPVGVSCALYQAWRPVNLPEVLELLTYNSDFVPAMLFAYLTRSSIVCPGATMAMRSEVLEAAGGLKPLADYFVEDFELARRVVEKGYRIALIPHIAKMDVDLPSFADWWRHQLYWDQNTKAVNPVGFLLTGLVRGIPFALLYGLLGGTLGWSLLAVSGGLRILTGIINGRLLKDSGSLKLIWLLPLRDLGGMAVWLVSLFKRRTCWRGRLYAIKKGKMEPVE